MPQKEIILVDIRSNYNVGAIFRTADGAGVGKVWLCGYTPTPRDRFGRAVTEIHKTALGAELVMPWEHRSDAVSLLQEKKAAGWTIAVVEQSPRSILLQDFVVPDRVVYIVGSETVGVQRDILELADVVIELPMYGQKESLNVSVTAGIVMYHR